MLGNELIKESVRAIRRCAWCLMSMLNSLKIIDSMYIAYLLVYIRRLVDNDFDQFNSFYLAQSS